jgi:hypothetical protein
LGLSPCQATALCSDIHLHAVRSLASIYASYHFMLHQHASASSDAA